MQRGKRTMRMKSYLALVLVIALALPFAWADYGPKGAVVVLDEKNFEKEVLESNDYWIVEFYAPWCGHCKKLEPEYKKAAKALKEHARLGAVDATANQHLAQKYGIRGYPTIKEFGAKKKSPKDYPGGRTKKDIVEYVKNSEEAKKLGVSGSISTVDFHSVYQFLQMDGSTPTALFFGSPQSKKKDKKRAPSWLSSLSNMYSKKKKVQIAYVPGNEKKIAHQLGLSDDDLPAIAMIFPSSKKFITSSISPLNEASSKAFIDENIKQGGDDSQDLPHFPSPDVAKKKPQYQLRSLDATNLKTCLTKRGKMCVIVSREDENVAKSLAKKYRRDPFVFLHTSPSNDLFISLQSSIGAVDTNAFVLKPGRKPKYTAISSTDDNLSTTLDRIVEGSGSFSTLPSDIHNLLDSTHDEL